MLNDCMRHIHIEHQDPHSSLMLAIPISIDNNSGIAHVLEHLLLTGSQYCDNLFFEARAGSVAVDMNAITNCRYLAIHFTCENTQEYFRLLELFSAALFTSSWTDRQFSMEVGDNLNPGIVVNEMKGVFSNIHSNLGIKTYANLFQSGPKRFNPGGDPALIGNIGPQQLDDFRGRYFHPENLIAVSYGAMDPVKIQQSLMRLTGSDIGRSVEDNELSIAHESVTEVNLPTCFVPQELVSLGVLITQGQASSEVFESILLDCLLKQYDAVLNEMAAEQEIDFIVRPIVEKNEDDRFLFAVCGGGLVGQSSELFSRLSQILTALVQRLDESSLACLTEKACYEFLTPGDAKYGAGIAISIQVLDHYLQQGELSPNPGNSLDIPQITKKYFRKQPWLELINTLIIENPHRAVLRTTAGQKSQSRSVDKSAFSTSKLQVINGVRSEFQRRQSSLGRLPDRYPKQTILPEIYCRNANIVCHYRLSAIQTSTVKLLVPVPYEALSNEVMSDLHGYLQWMNRLVGGKLPLFELRYVIGQPRYGLESKMFLSMTFHGLAETASITLSKLTECFSHVWDDSSSVELESDVQVAGGRTTLLPHDRAIHLASRTISSAARSVLALQSSAGGNNSVPIDVQDIPQVHQRFCEQKILAFVASGDSGKALSLPDGFILQKEIAAVSDNAIISVNDSWCDDYKESEKISGEVNYCSRVWGLSRNFGVNPKMDAVPHIFAALATSVYLEPMVRGINRAYAASADVRADLGVLAMFSYRDPESIKTDEVFKHAYEQVVNGQFSAYQFEQARRRAIARLSKRGSIDARCEARFDNWLYGYDDNYFVQLGNGLLQIDMKTFSKSVNNAFLKNESCSYILVGEHNIAE